MRWLLSSVSYLSIQKLYAHYALFALHTYYWYLAKPNNYSSSLQIYFFYVSTYLTLNFYVSIIFFYLIMDKQSKSLLPTKCLLFFNTPCILITSVFLYYCTHQTPIQSVISFESIIIKQKSQQSKAGIHKKPKYLCFVHNYFMLAFSLTLTDVLFYF